MELEPKISLIIPAYNEERYLTACLESVLRNAATQLFEIIVIDNASTDQTAKIATSFSGVRVVREEQKGLTRARQRGFTEARGDILAYIDADTRLPLGWIEQVLTEFRREPNLASLSGPYIYYDLDPFQQLLIKFYWSILAWPSYLIIGYLLVGGNFAIRKEVLTKMNGFDTSIEFYGEDTNIARRAKSFGLVKFKLSFFIYSSARRLKGQGFIKTAWLYIVNFLSEVLRQKPATSNYQDLR